VKVSAEAYESLRGNADEKIAGELLAASLEEELHRHPLSVEEIEKRSGHAGPVRDAEEAQLDKTPGDLQREDLQGFTALHRRVPPFLGLGRIRALSPAAHGSLKM
jgi:hypothetical protein